jgi:hypothetical protein
MVTSLFMILLESLSKAVVADGLMQTVVLTKLEGMLFIPGTLCTQSLKTEDLAQVVL